MISIIDLGYGNFASILRMINKVGGIGSCINTVQDILKAEKMIFPGVGHFDVGINMLQKNHLVDALHQRVLVDKIPLLGICLGMQLLCNKSEEGHNVGLGFVDAEVNKFRFPPEAGLKVPHMGWNSVHVARKNLLIVSKEEQRFYFVHSYYVVPKDTNITIATASHGVEFCAAFQKDNIFGVQFHPEKSHRFGMALMKRFVEL